MAFVLWAYAKSESAARRCSGVGRPPTTAAKRVGSVTGCGSSPPAALTVVGDAAATDGATDSLAAGGATTAAATDAVLVSAPIAVTGVGALTGGGCESGTEESQMEERGPDSTGR